MSKPLRAWIVPRLADPRWLQVSFLASYVVYALVSPGFAREPAQYLWGAAACVGLDFLLGLRYAGPRLAPLSGLITSMGLLLLCDSPHVWPYPLLGAVAVLSKHFVQVEGRHVFNPLNFAVVVGLLFLSGEMTVVAGRWGGSLTGMLAIAALGTLTVWRAKRLDLAAAYALTFFAGACARSWLSGAQLVTLLTPMTGAAFQLFTFFMITDPKTTPETPRGRWAFGFLVGALDAVLRYRQVSHAPFYALFALSAFGPLFARAGERVWSTRVVTLGVREP